MESLKKLNESQLRRLHQACIDEINRRRQARLDRRRTGKPVAWSVQIVTGFGETKRWVKTVEGARFSTAGHRLGVDIEGKFVKTVDTDTFASTSPEGSLLLLCANPDVKNRNHLRNQPLFVLAEVRGGAAIDLTDSPPCGFMGVGLETLATSDDEVDANDYPNARKLTRMPRHPMLAIFAKLSELGVLRD